MEETIYDINRKIHESVGNAEGAIVKARNEGFLVIAHTGGTEVSLCTGRAFKDMHPSCGVRFNYTIQPEDMDDSTVYMDDGMTVKVATEEAVKKCMDKWDNPLAESKAEFYEYCEEHGLDASKVMEKTSADQDEDGVYTCVLNDAMDIIAELGNAKQQASEGGDPEIGGGVWLMNGSRVLKDTEGYRSEMDTDAVAEGYTVGDIIKEQLYISADDGAFYAADDDDILDVLYERGWK